MEELNVRIHEALKKEEAQSEQFANLVRIITLLILALIALLNVKTVSLKANIMNFTALTISLSYGITVFFFVRQMGYRPIMKYITSCVDVILIMALLFSYTTIDAPSVALKNYVFSILFLLIGLTAFRYDQSLTWTVGGLAVALYMGLFAYLVASHSVVISQGSYEKEFFSLEVTYAGQITKIAILCGYITLIAFLANYSRKLFVKLVHDELKLAHEKELMDMELTVASVVQTKLLPHTFPIISGLEMYGLVEQGKSVGGDYCDFIKLADDVLLVVLADVSGNGIPAALIMSQVHASMHLLASMKMDMEELTQKLNALLYSSTNKKDFISFFVAEINTSRCVLTYVNAGHPPPFIHSGQQFKMLSERSIPLGIQPVIPNLRKRDVAFTPGDLFIAYTDGLLEQNDLQGQEYGEERLQEFIAHHYGQDVHSFVMQLLSEVKSFGKGNGLNDDVSVAAIKFFKE